jgi:hypothetical protein
VPLDLLKNGRVVPNWRLGVAAPLASDFRFNGFFVSGGHIFGSSSVELNFLNFLGEQQAFISGYWRHRWPFWCFLWVFCG